MAKCGFAYFHSEHRTAASSGRQSNDSAGKGKVFPLQARCGTEGGYRYSSTLP